MKERKAESGWGGQRIKPQSVAHTISQAVPNFLPKSVIFFFSQSEKILVFQPIGVTAAILTLPPLSVLFLVLLHPLRGGDGFRCGRTQALYIATLPGSRLSFF